MGRRQSDWMSCGIFAIEDFKFFNSSDFSAFVKNLDLPQFPHCEDGTGEKSAINCSIIDPNDEALRALSQIQQNLENHS